MTRLTGEDGRVTVATRPAAAETKARDPVCGALVDLSAAATAVHDGHSYFFCSPECRARFQADPGTFLRRG